MLPPKASIKNVYVPLLVTLLALQACSSAPSPAAGESAGISPQVTAYDPTVRIPDEHPRDVVTTPVHPQFQGPLEEMVVINYYGWRKRRMHEGIDLRAKVGTPVYAAAGGEIIHAGRGMHGYGQLVVIDHGGGWSTIYAHLSKIAVKVGQHVKLGEFIADSGKTGRAHGAHLHFEIRKGADPLDPLLLLGAVQYSVR